MRQRVLAVVIMTLTLAAFTSSQTVVSATTTVRPTTKALPAVGLATTPAGWVSVAYGNAQVSVPPTWWVLYNSYPCPTGSPPGEVFVNPPPGLFACPLEIAPGPSTTVSFGPPRSPLSNVLGHPEVINGILVYPYPMGPQSSYLVPSLGVEITVRRFSRSTSPAHAHLVTAFGRTRTGVFTGSPVVMAAGDLRRGTVLGPSELAGQSDPGDPWSGSHL